jgi:hypothetical protein
VRERMRSRPTEPTAALAALISGNHRFLAARARAAMEGAGPLDVSAISPIMGGRDRASKKQESEHDHDFAVFVSLAIEAEKVAQIFDLPSERPPALVLSERGGLLELPEASSLNRVLSASRLVILVVLTQLLAPDSCGIAFADAERRSLETLATALETSDMLRKRMRSRELRAVAAVFDPTSGRVTWLGEHPEQARFLNRD